MKNKTHLIIALTLAFLFGSLNAGILSYLTYYIYSAPFWAWCGLVWGAVVLILLMIVSQSNS